MPHFISMPRYLRRIPNMQAKEQHKCNICSKTTKHTISFKNNFICYICLEKTSIDITSEK